MFLFVDGEIIILSVEQVLELYYQEYVSEFGSISRSQFEGSQEYEISYANAQRDHKNAVIIYQGLQVTFNAITEQNQQIKRPAVLHSRVSERFLEAGYIASIRLADLATRGIVAICVDYTPDAEQNAIIADLIVNEMLPAGQHMEGDINYHVTISNGQPITASWKAPVRNDIDFKIVLTVDRNSEYAKDTVDEIIERFLSNFAAQNQLGNDITPEAYYQISRDAPWASNIETTYELNGAGGFIDTITASNYDDKYIATLTAANVDIIG